MSSKGIEKPSSVRRCVKTGAELRRERREREQRQVVEHKEPECDCYSDEDAKPLKNADYEVCDLCAKKRTYAIPKGTKPKKRKT